MPAHRNPDRISNKNMQVNCHQGQIDVCGRCNLHHEQPWIASKESPNQSGRSPRVVSLFSATNFSSYIIELLQLHDTIQIQWNYAWTQYTIANWSHLMI